MSTTGISSTFKFVEIDSLYQKCREKFPKLPVQLKPEQAEGIHSVLCGKDLLLLLPTNFGKSLVFTVPGIILAQVSKKSTSTVVISPLVALVKDGIRRLKDIGIQAFHHTGGVAGNIVLDELVAEGPEDPIFIFLSPEVVREKVVKEKIWENKPCFLAVDEGHVASEWGKHFRKDYSCIYEIRCGLECPMGVFTATITPEVLNDIILKTGIRRTNAVTIAVQPDRPNIFIDLRAPKQSLDSLEFVANELKQAKECSAKTIIFVTSLQSTVDLFLWFEDQLRECMCYSVNGKPIGYLVNYFSSVTEAEAKEAILQEFVKPDGYLRVLICTVAFGMGMDIPNIRTVVIWGLPASAMTLWQEIGRAGRDQLPSKAIIFPFHTRCHAKDEKIFTFPDNACIRKSILSQFYISGRDSETSGYRTNCCSYCDDHLPPQVNPAHGIVQKKSLMDLITLK